MAVDALAPCVELSSYGIRYSSLRALCVWWVLRSLGLSELIQTSFEWFLWEGWGTIHSKAVVIHILPPHLESIIRWGLEKIAAIFANGIFIYVFLNKISNTISLKYFPWGLIDNKPSLIQVMTFYLNQCWYSVLTHLCVTWPQWARRRVLYECVSTQAPWWFR